jgi:hypothetical membrane protein
MHKSARWGSVLWVLSIQYFIVQFFVGLTWPSNYSVFHNTISDLGNTVCGTYSGNFVCSPHYIFMNASFILLGGCQALGAVLLYRFLPKSRLLTLGLACMVAAGVGTVLVGLFPENTVSALHIVGAGAPFVLGNVGLLLLAASLGLPRTLKMFTYVLGGLGLVSLVLFLTHTYAGLGIGGTERLVAYPQTLWLVIFGTYKLAKP